MAQVPVGTIIAFGLGNADFTALQQQGWWICDGRTVTDPAAAILQNSPTPNLMSVPAQYRLGCFLVGAGSGPVGSTGGQATAAIPDLPVKVQTDGWNSQQQMNAAPGLTIHSADTWITGSPITSSGKAIPGSARVVTIPPYYAVIYLILVK